METIKINCKKCDSEIEFGYEFTSENKLLRDKGIKFGYYVKCQNCKTMNTGHI